MQDKIVYVPVSVEDELPTKDAKYFCIGELSDITPKFYCWYNTEVKRFHNDSVRLKVTHWLKPTPLSELLKEKPSAGDEEIEKLAAELLKQKDEQIKELCEVLGELLSKSYQRRIYISDDVYYKAEFTSELYNNAKSILQKHNAVTKQ